MLHQTLAILIPVVVFVTVISLLARLRVFTRPATPGRAALVSGGALLLVVSIWQAVKSVPAYGEWFLESVYPFLDLAHFLLFVLALVLAGVGLARYAGYWQSREEEVASRDRKLSLLDDLQREARQPYQLMDLLNLVLKGVIAHLPECAGAVFLLNRSQRQFVLASAAGLTKDETAALEYYPLERNIVSQAVDLGEPLVSSSFAFPVRSGQTVGVRFNSCLVLPLVSGLERIGGIILLAEQEKFFGRGDIMVLAPVAEWLAEKIKSARLTRELTSVKSEIERRQEAVSDLTTRLAAAMAAFTAPDPADSFCRALTGLVSSQSVHLYGLVNGVLTFHGTGDRIEALSENYRTALIDALDRNRPLVVNQEAQTDDGRTFIAWSSLIIPLTGDHGGDALLLRRESGPFRPDASDLKNLELFATMASLVLDHLSARRQALTQRRGFQSVLRLLRFDPSASAKEDWSQLMEQLTEMLPADNSACLVLSRRSDGRFKMLRSRPGDEKIPGDMVIQPGEGDLGKALSSREPLFINGPNSVSQWLESLEKDNREKLGRLWGSNRAPVSVALCPIADLENVAVIVFVFFFDIMESERGEWERLLTLTCGLYSMRLTIRQVTGWKTDLTKPPVAMPANTEGIVNRLNNFLSGVLGNAELVSAESDLSSSAQLHVRNIVVEAEHAAEYLRSTLGKSREISPRQTATTVETRTGLREVLDAELDKAHISENVYMIAGRPRELELSMEASGDVPLATDSVRQLFMDAVERFASLAQDDDIISIKAYTRGSHAYLDISRHQRHFPAVEAVAGFGVYHTPADVMRRRPSDTFLKHLSGTDCAYSYDRFGDAPTYLSFKFPLRRSAVEDVATVPKARVLAIDDQTVILDLISAMCQSLGFEAQTAVSGEEGVRLASQSSFDIVLTDLAMPDISGLEVARRIRHLHPQVPIILVTGYEVNTSQSELEAAGITEVLYKPFRIEQLTDIIRSALTTGSFS
ncbi:MAG: response regulator [Candidatus Zixiibacteriota bacterium]